MSMMMSSMYWFLPLTLFLFVDGQVADCNDNDSTPLRILIEPCEKWYYNVQQIDWEVRELGVGLTNAGSFLPGTEDFVAENFVENFCLVPSGCYFVDLSAYYGGALIGGGTYSVFYDGALIFTGGEFETDDFSNFPPVQSIKFGNGCPSDTPSTTPTTTQLPTATQKPSMSPTVTQLPTQSMSPTAYPSATPSMSPTAYPSASPSMSPTITQSPSAAPSMSPSATPTATQLPSMSPTATRSISPTATQSMSPSHKHKASGAPTPSSAGSSDYTAVLITVVIASLAVLCVGWW